MSDLLTCTHCKRDKHYTGYNKAGWGRLAPDGTKRHQLCKGCKKYKHQLSNPVRFWNNDKFISPNNKYHPFHDEYKQGGYEAVFSAMGLEFPKFDPDAVAPKTLASNSCNEWLDWLEIPQKDREVRVGKYQVDALYKGHVYEFYGTYYHADPRHYKPTDMIFRKTAAEVWEKDDSRIKYILSRTKSPCLIMWESDWRDFIHNKGLQNEN